MRGLAERRELTKKAIAKRTKLLKSLGTQSGTIYEKHVAKINKSFGYMRDGNLTHYAACGFNEKTRSKSRRGKSFRFKHSDALRALRKDDWSI